MSKRGWTALTVALALAMSLTAVANARRGTSQANVGVPAARVKDASHGSKPTWGTAARPDYTSIAFAPDGTLYATDVLNNRVYKVTSAGRFGHTVVVAGSGPGVDLEPGGFQHWKYIPNHGWITVGAYGGDGQHGTDALFSAPFFLTFDTAGDMLIADHLNGRIREITTDGFVQTVAGVGNGGPHYGTWTAGVGPAAGDGGPATHSLLDAPWGLAFDSHGNLFIADRDHDAVREIDTSGIITTVAGVGRHGYNGDNRPASEARLARPLTVAVDAANNLYIADEDNRRIRMVDHSGTITTFAGDGRYGCSGDGGQAVDASFRDPNQIDFAPDGSMLITDNECHDIRRIAPNGTITTLAHNANSTCDGVVGADVRHVPVGSFVYGPDGLLYLAVCHKVVRVDDHGIVHLFARAPTTA